MLPDKLRNKLAHREKDNSIRTLNGNNDLIDFSSNDYLGFASSESIYNRTLEILKEYQINTNGSGGSRLLTGNHKLYPEAENTVCKFHNSESALIFNSGYNANLGLFSAVPQRGDIIVYDELIHASIRDGIQLGHARSFKFRHNNLENLLEVLERNRKNFGEAYVVTESVFSMDGDSPDLREIANLCRDHNCRLIVDEAHAIGVLGTGKGLVCDYNLEKQVFARLVTFGKALGSHGAAILGCKELYDYLVNFARSLIYTTALPPHSVANIIASYEKLKSDSTDLIGINSNIAILRNVLRFHNISNYINSTSAIHSILIPGNTAVKKMSSVLRAECYELRPILSPTVPEGQERLRICVHAFNSEEEINEMISLLAKHLSI